MPIIYRLNYSDLTLYMRQAVRAGKRNREICGLLLAQHFRLTFVPVKNSATQIGSFEMWYPWIEIALKNDTSGAYSIVGSYHSHPVSDAIPGQSDIEGARLKSLMLILACWDQKVGLWQIHSNYAQKVILCIYRGT